MSEPLLLKTDGRVSFAGTPTFYLNHLQVVVLIALACYNPIANSGKAAAAAANAGLCLFAGLCARIAKMIDKTKVINAPNFPFLAIQCE